MFFFRYVTGCHRVTCLVFQDFKSQKHFTINSDVLLHQTSSKSLWLVEPSEGEMLPGSQLDLSVVAHLTDTLQFKDTLKVSIQHGQTHTISLAATGTGTTIVSDRPFTPSVELGTCFRYKSKKLEIYSLIFRVSHLSAALAVSFKPRVMPVPLQADQSGSENSAVILVD